MLIHTVRSGLPATQTAPEIRSCAYLRKDAPKATSPLTVRENEVMALLARGLPYKLIADELMISFSAVNHHLSKIYRKLGVSNRIEAVSLWTGSSETA
jgi:DNA-binding NarL/FixJ family response regulator